MIKPLIDQRHCLGHPAIDADHAVIGDLWLRAVHARHLELPLHLARLKKAMKRHFEHEAALLADAGRSLCRSHQQEHDVLLHLCSEALDLCQRDWRKTRLLLRNRFARLLREHIVSMDLCAVLTLHTAPSSVPCDHLTAG
jgi:hemerythrin